MQIYKSTMCDELIQKLVADGVLPKKDVAGWREAKGQLSASPNPGEIVVFKDFFIRGLGLPTSEFFRRVLDFYGLELVNLNPNSILHMAIFAHLCEAFLGIHPHFLLFRYFFICKPYPNAAAPNVFGGGGFQLRDSMRNLYINIPLKSSNRGWHPEWFYTRNHDPALPSFQGHAPVVGSNWSAPLSDDEILFVQPIVDLIQKHKKSGLNGVIVAWSFCQRGVQPLKKQYHPAWEYNENGPDTTRENVNEVPQHDVLRRLESFFLAPISPPSANSVKAYSIQNSPPKVWV